VSAIENVWLSRMQPDSMKLVASSILADSPNACKAFELHAHGFSLNAVNRLPLGTD
jgi:hypothetical protein